MKPGRWVEIENLYNEIVDLDPVKRDARLASISDDEVRCEVISLIQAGPLPPSVAECFNEERGRVLVQLDLPEELHGSHLGHGWVYVMVADVDAHCARARGAGAQILGDPHGSPDGTFRGYSARDPEGNLWSFGTDRPGG